MPIDSRTRAGHSNEGAKLRLDICGTSPFEIQLLVALEMRSEYEIGGSILGARHLLVFA